MVYQMLIHMVGVPAARQQQVRKAEEWLAARGKVEDDMQQPKDKRGSMAFKRGASHVKAVQSSLEIGVEWRALSSSGTPESVVGYCKQTVIALGFFFSHNYALVIELRVTKFAVEHVLVDQGSTSEIMYYRTFHKLGLNDLDLLPTDYLLFSFNANPEYPLGKITLSIHLTT
ncbi:unnamed protein product [Camellia sinensis]